MVILPSFELVEPENSVQVCFFLLAFQIFLAIFYGLDFVLYCVSNKSVVRVSTPFSCLGQFPRKIFENVGVASDLIRLNEHSNPLRSALTRKLQF
jgi:hypothetical protein